MALLERLPFRRRTIEADAVVGRDNQLWRNAMNLYKAGGIAATAAFSRAIGSITAQAFVWFGPAQNGSVSNSSV